MPELPEVETIRRTIAPAIVGKKITRVEVLTPKMVLGATPAELWEALRDRCFSSLRRRGKYLVLELGEPFPRRGDNEDHLLAEPASSRSTGLASPRSGGPDQGEQPWMQRDWVVIHLKMAGRLLIHRADDLIAKHTHVVWGFADGTELRYIDLRHFGRVVFWRGNDPAVAVGTAASSNARVDRHEKGGPGRGQSGHTVSGTTPTGRPGGLSLAWRYGPQDPQQGLNQANPSEKDAMGREALLAGLIHLGPEPLSPDFTVNYLMEELALHKGRIKPLLLDQTFLAGLGNIYADEVLFQAAIHPEREARSLAQDEATRLHAAIREILTRAIELRGTTFATYVDGEGKKGEFASRLSVYGREGEPCPRCGNPIQRRKVGGRSAHFCPACQR